MHETTLTAITSSLVLNEIQRINVTANVVAEQQVKRKDLIFIEKKISFENLAIYLYYKFNHWNIGSSINIS
jgi:hypothetical protein